MGCPGLRRQGRPDCSPFSCKSRCLSRPRFPHLHSGDKMGAGHRGAVRTQRAACPSTEPGPRPGAPVQYTATQNRKPKAPGSSSPSSVKTGLLGRNPPNPCPREAICSDRRSQLPQFCRGSRALPVRRAFARGPAGRAGRHDPERGCRGPAIRVRRSESLTQEPRRPAPGGADPGSARRLGTRTPELPTAVLAAEPRGWAGIQGGGGQPRPLFLSYWGLGFQVGANPSGRRVPRNKTWENSHISPGEKPSGCLRLLGRRPQQNSPDGSSGNRHPLLTVLGAVWPSEAASPRRRCQQGQCHSEASSRGS